MTALRTGSFATSDTTSLPIEWCTSSRPSRRVTRSRSRQSRTSARTSGLASQAKMSLRAPDAQNMRCSSKQSLPTASPYATTGWNWWAKRSRSVTSRSRMSAESACVPRHHDGIPCTRKSKPQHLPGLLRDFLRVEVLYATLARGDQRFADLGTLDHQRAGFGRFGEIALVQQQRRTVDRFADRRPVVRHDRKTEMHRLEQRNPKAFVLGQRDEAPRGAVVRGERRVRDAAREVHGPGEPEPLDERDHARVELRLGAVRADEDEG